MLRWHATIPIGTPQLQTTLLRMRSLMLLLCVLGLSAAEPFSLNKLASATKDISSMRVTFVQEKHLAILDEPVVSPGLIEVDRKRYAVRWEFTGKSVLLFLDGKLRRFGAEGKEETITAKDQGVNSMVAQMKAMLDGDYSSMENMFTITPAADGIPQLNFVPKTPDIAKYITSLQIRWRPDLSAPEHMLLIAADDDITEYKFAEPQLGVEIPLERFTNP